VLGEHETQLSNTAAQAGGLLNQVDLKTCVGQVERRAHTPNAAAHYQGRSRTTTEVPGRHCLH
jgi:hypothetical protein